MSLSLRAELETWAAALKAYDERDFETSLDLFSCMTDSSKILTNMGLIYATIGEHETAVDHFIAATNLDIYLAIAHFQCGVSNFLLERYDLALLNFEDAHLYLRGHEAINYEQIGLKFKLFSAEILFNKGLAQINLGYAEGGMAEMQKASKQKVTDEHRVIDEAIRDNGEGYTVFSIPVGVLYRPSESKLKNVKSKDYLGKAKLVAANRSSDAFTEFTGVKKLKAAVSTENLNGKEGEDKPDADPTLPNTDASVPAPRTTLERSRTTPESRADVHRPDAATILASRRWHSVSNPVNVPRPSLALGLFRSNTSLRRANTGRSVGGAAPAAAVLPLSVKAPQGTTAGTAGPNAGGAKTTAETGAAPGAAPATLKGRPSLRRLKSQGTLQIVQQSVAPPVPQSLQPGHYISVPQDVAPTPLVLPAAPAQAQAPGGSLTQFCDTYMDAYMNDPASQLTFPLPPTMQMQRPGTPSSQRQSPAASMQHQLPQPQPQSQPQPQQPQPQQPPPAWMQSPPSSAKLSSNAGSGPGMSRTPSRGANANAGMAGAGTGKGGVGHAGGGVPVPRRKPSRRPTARRRTVYDDDEGDDGFVTGENDELQMVNIRVKLHYQGDVRGMTIPPTTAFDEFVERVTTKFGTSLRGLGMKFVDEDGTKISLRDESDFELAIETARESSKERSEGKIEVWCVDVE